MHACAPVMNFFKLLGMQIWAKVGWKKLKLKRHPKNFGCLNPYFQYFDDFGAFLKFDSSVPSSTQGPPVPVRGQQFPGVGSSFFQPAHIF